MCKLFAIVEIENQVNAEKFAKSAIPFITKTDNHGLGIMRLGENGVHIQRWLTPPTVVRTKKSRSLMKYEKALMHQENEEGTRSERLYSIAIHGRFATCEKSLQNTHPFRRNGTALMHNGIITNPEKYKRPLSTCDSEVLLSQYLDHNVKKSLDNLTEALRNVGGYYASIVFNDNGTIDIWRDESASLYLAHVRGVGVVIATTEEIIVQAAKKRKAFITGIDEILPYTSIRWFRGLLPSIHTFEAIKPISLLSPAIERSQMGYDADKYENWYNTEEWPKQDKDYITAEEEADLKEIKWLQGLNKEI